MYKYLMVDRVPVRTSSTDSLKRYWGFSGQEGLQEIKQAAINLEETCYNAASNQVGSTFFLFCETSTFNFKFEIREGPYFVLNIICFTLLSDFQYGYLRDISLRMLTLESNYNHDIPGFSSRSTPTIASVFLFETGTQ